jgi:addiction module HigA family antidote
MVKKRKSLRRSGVLDDLRNNRNRPLCEIHPGEILQTEFLEPLGLTARDLSARLEFSSTAIQRVIRGKRGITADLALRLGKFFRISGEFWMGLQNDFDLRQAANRVGSLACVKPISRAAVIRAQDAIYPK